MLRYGLFTEKDGGGRVSSLDTYYKGSGSDEIVGKVSDFKEIVLKEYKDRGLTNDPVDPDILKVTFPPQLFVDVLFYKAIKTEIFIERKMVIKQNYILEFLNHDMLAVHNWGIPNFVCGFIDHKNSFLQMWRTI